MAGNFIENFFPFKHFSHFRHTNEKYYVFNRKYIERNWRRCVVVFLLRNVSQFLNEHIHTHYLQRENIFHKKLKIYANDTPARLYFLWERIICCRSTEKRRSFHECRENNDIIILLYSEYCVEVWWEGCQDKAINFIATFCCCNCHIFDNWNVIFRLKKNDSTRITQLVI